MFETRKPEGIFGRFFCVGTRAGVVCALSVVAALCGFCGSLRADVVLLNSNPGLSAYDDVRNSIQDVFDQSASVTETSGFAGETNHTVIRINGTGNQTVPVVFLYDDGDYQFEFGYFRYTSSLKSMALGTAADKEAFAKAALATATIVFRDEERASGGGTQVVRDPDDAFTSTPDDRVRDHEEGPERYEAANRRTATLVGGEDYVFFIIPNNTLTAFNADAATDTNGDGSFFETFSLTGSSATAWPLFMLSGANPGLGADGSGEGYDQTFVFSGTRRSGFDPLNGISQAHLITFEDIAQRTGDNDFNDLHFVIGNVVPIPELTGAAGICGLLLSVFASLRRGPRR